MTISKKTFGWMQLLALTAVHGVLDLGPGTMHAVLPSVQEYFGISIALGGVLLAVFNAFCNGGQVLTGHWRENRERPLHLYIGLALCLTVCLFGLLPGRPSMFPVLLVLASVAGWGVAVPHPETLRALHSIEGIPTALATSIFMGGGALGFSLGSFFSTRIVDAAGLDGLLWFLILPALAIGLAAAMRLRLAVHDPHAAPAPAAKGVAAVPFWPIMLMATVAGVSSAILTWGLPQRLHEYGTGGLAAMLFVAGSAMGSFVMSAFAPRIGEIRCSIYGMVPGIAVLLAFIMLADQRWAVWLVLPVGMLAFGGYPILVGAARGAQGLTLGRRMGLMVGGVWGIACLFQMLMAWLADVTSIQTVMWTAPSGYVVAVVIGVYIVLRYKRKVRVPVAPVHAVILEPVQE